MIDISVGLSSIPSLFPATLYLMGVGVGGLRAKEGQVAVVWAPEWNQPAPPAGA